MGLGLFLTAKKPFLPLRPPPPPGRTLPLCLGTQHIVGFIPVAFPLLFSSLPALLHSRILLSHPPVLPSGPSLYLSCCMQWCPEICGTSTPLFNCPCTTTNATANSRGVCQWVRLPHFIENPASGRVAPYVRGLHSAHPALPRKPWTIQMTVCLSQQYST